MDTDQQKQKKVQVSPALKTGIIVVVVIILAVAGYYLAMSIMSPAPTPIGTILGDLRKYDGQIVTIHGEVTNRLGVMQFEAYGVKDETGQIWVVTQRGIPNAGEIVTVTGVVDEVIAIGQGSLTVLKEPAEVD